MLPKHGDAEEVREAVLEEIHSNFETNVNNVSEKVYYQVGA